MLGCYGPRSARTVTAFVRGGPGDGACAASSRAVVMPSCSTFLRRWCDDQEDSPGCMRSRSMRASPTTALDTPEGLRDPGHLLTPAGRHLGVVRRSPNLVLDVGCGYGDAGTASRRRSPIPASSNRLELGTSPGPASEAGILKSAWTASPRTPPAAFERGVRRRRAAKLSIRPNRTRFCQDPAQPRRRFVVALLARPAALRRPLQATSSVSCARPSTPQPVSPVPGTPLPAFGDRHHRPLDPPSNRCTRPVAMRG